MLHDPSRPTPKKRPEPRQPRCPQLLPAEKRVAEVVRIVGKKWRDNVAGMLPVLTKMQREAADARARKRSGHDKRLAKQFDTGLRRMTAAVDKSPWRDEPEVRSRLDFFQGFSEGWKHRAATEPERPRRNADAKALAAEMALFVFRQCEIEPTTTRGGKFERSTAALYGDMRVDMSHHCRTALRAEALYGCKTNALDRTAAAPASAKPRAKRVVDRRYRWL